MDEDTIFPVLPLGEQTLGKYKHLGCFGNLETIIILTNFRLLIRRNYTFFHCYTRSAYTSIALDSVDRVDEEPADLSFKFISAMLSLFIGSIIMLGFGIPLNITILTIVAIVILISSVVALVLRCLLGRHNLISLRGTFGSEAFILEKALARELEGRLLEICYQKRVSSSKQATAVASSPGYAGQLYPSDAYMVASNN